MSETCENYVILKYFYTDVFSYDTLYHLCNDLNHNTTEIVKENSSLLTK